MTKAASGTATSILAPTIEGDYRLYIIDDGPNRSAASTAILNVDDTSPTVNISYSVSGPYKESDLITVTATFTEANLMAGTPQIAIDYIVDSDVSATNMLETSNKVWTYIANIPAANDGLATITITGQDDAGNTVGAHSNETFIVDNIAPDITLSTTASPGPTNTSPPAPA